MTILMFRNGLFILIDPLQLMRNNSSDASSVVVVAREFFSLVLFSRLSLSLTLFHKHFDQIDVVLEAAALSDE